MIGVLLNEMEIKEMKYLLMREMDEILFDLKAERINHSIKKKMEERYKHLFTLFKRVATPSDCMKYMRTKQKMQTQYKNIKKKKKSY